MTSSPSIKNHNSALVLFSGGQDSATVLAWALERFQHVQTLGFYYGQKHQVELKCRQEIRKKFKENFPHWAKRLGEDHILSLPELGSLADSSLTSPDFKKTHKNNLPATYVPGRNIIFLNYAAILAYKLGIQHLATGVCETDYSGYPDCRDNFIKAMQVAINLGMEENFIFHTPLMWLTKAQTWELAYKVGGFQLVQIINKESHSCYVGQRELLHDWGYGCGTCPACELRKKGWDLWQEQYQHG